MDCKNFISEFLTRDQLVMLGQNKRNMVTFVDRQEDIPDIIMNPSTVEKSKNHVSEAISCGASTNLSDTQIQIKQLIDQKLQQSIPGYVE
jgi:hypothetical protein